MDGMLFFLRKVVHVTIVQYRQRVSYVRYFLENLLKNMFRWSMLN